MTPSPARSTTSWWRAWGRTSSSTRSRGGARSRWWSTAASCGRGICGRASRARKQIHRKDAKIGSAYPFAPSRLCGSLGAHQKMNAATPLIETARLRLRGHRVADLGDCAAMWADASVVQHIGGRPFAAEETWAKSLGYAGLWSLLGFGYWAIEERDSGRYVGDVGFADFKRYVQPSFDGAPEIGWALMPWAQGKGFATEAVGAAVAWGDRHFAALR